MGNDSSQVQEKEGRDSEASEDEIESVNDIGKTKKLFLIQIVNWIWIYLRLRWRREKQQRK